MLNAFSDAYVSFLLLCCFAVVLGWPLILFLLYRAVMREIRSAERSLAVIAGWYAHLLRTTEPPTPAPDPRKVSAMPLSQFGR